MAKTNDNFIGYELKFLDKKLKELKQYITDTSFSELEDRLAISGIKKMNDGSTFETYKIVATKEIQRKDLTSALKDYAEILNTVDQMRTQEAKKLIAVRGDEKLGSQAKAFLNARENQ